MLWKSANKDCAPDDARDIARYGWIVKDGTVVPAISSQPVAPEVLDVVSCSCVTCDQAGCGCKKAKLSCTDYCECGAGDKCKNPHTESTEDETDSSSDEEDDDPNWVEDNER